MNKQRILLFDLEVAPIDAWIWSLWAEPKSASYIKEDWYLLCWSAAWLDEEYVMYDSLNLHKRYKSNKEDDRIIVESLWKLLDEADIVIAHNGKKFDVRKINTRFIAHGMKPPSSYKVVDTLTIARSRFGFTSNRLDYLGEYLGVGRKLETGGFDKLHKPIIEKKCKKTWKLMIDYNIQDIELLEKVYRKLAPWAKNHPNAFIHVDSIYPLCPVCGSQDINKNGTYSTNTQIYQKWRCLSCGHSLRSPKAEKKENLTLRSI